MKKFYAILCAVTLLCCVSAHSQLLTPKQLKTKQLKEQVRKTHDKRSVMTLGKIARDSRVSPRQAAKTKMQSPRKAEHKDVIISDVFSSFYPDVNAVWYSLTPDSWSPSFSFSIHIPEGMHDVELGKTYTFDDMEHEEGYNPNCWTDEEWNEYEIVEATFKKTRGVGFDVHIEATAKDVEGNTFNISYDEDPIEIKEETKEVSINSERPDKQRMDDGSWLLRCGGEEQGYSLQLSYFSDNATSPVGSFKYLDFDPNQCTLTEFTGEEDEGGDQIVIFHKVKDGIIRVEEDENAIYIIGVLTCDDGYYYSIEATMAKPKANNTVIINSSDLAVDDYWYPYTREIKLGAYVDEQFVTLFIYPESTGEGMTGTYTIGTNGTRATVKPTPDDEEVDAYSGEFTVNYDNGTITVTGSILCYNNTLYNLNLSYTKPEKTREQTLTFEDLTCYYDYGAFEVFGYNTDETQAIDLVVNYGTNMTGNFTEENMELDYSFVATDCNAEEKTAKFFQVLFADIQSVFNEEDNTISITGTLLCRNSNDNADIPEFTVNINAKVPAPFERDEKADLSHDFASYTINDENLEDFGIIDITANDGEAAIALTVFAGEGKTGLTAGTYTISDTEAPMTVLASEGMEHSGALTFSLVGLINETKKFTNVWYLVSGTVEVDDNGTITVDALNSNGNKVECKLTNGTNAITSVKADNTKTVKKYLKDGQILIKRNGKTYNIQGIQKK